MEQAKLESLFLRPLQQRVERRKRWIFAQLLTDGVGGAFLRGYYSREDTNNVYPLSSPEHWLDAITANENRGCIWYCYGGAKYDFKYLIAPLLTRIQHDGWTVTPIVQGGGNVIGYCFTVGGFRFELRDSFAVLGSDLESLARIYGSESGYEAEIDCSDNVVPDTHYHQLISDLMVVKRALLQTDSLLVEHFNTHVQWSAGSTALKAWRKTLPRHFIRVRPNVDSLAREAYYGGLMYLRDTQPHKDVVALDVNASYAHAMRAGVPTGPGMKSYEEIPSRPGIYRVAMIPPDHALLPFLPVREKGGTFYPNVPSPFFTTLTSIEIEAGRQAGYDIEVSWGYVFDQIEHVFDAFVNKCEALELPNRGNALGHTVKLLRNSLYGKFGTRKTRTEYLLSKDLPEGYSFVLDPAAQSGMSMDDMIIDGLYQTIREKQKPYMFPHWAAWITANARLHLMQYAQEIGEGNILYIDTDSLFVSESAYQDAARLRTNWMRGWYGDLKVQEQYSIFHAHGPKHYTFIRKGGGSGIKVAGMPGGVASVEGSAQHKTERYSSLINPLRLVKNPEKLVEDASRTYPGEAWDIPEDESIEEEGSE